MDPLYSIGGVDELWEINVYEYSRIYLRKNTFKFDLTRLTMVYDDLPRLCQFYELLDCNIFQEILW